VYYVTVDGVLVHNAYGSDVPNTATVTFKHILKGEQTTDITALRGEIQRHVDAWNQILATEGMSGLKRRLHQWERFGNDIEAAGRRFTRGLGPAGDGKVWPHYPDMATGGRPKSAVGEATDKRLNSIIGGQANTLRQALLEMPDDVTELVFELLLK
jgi:hypothetical protein